MSNQNLYKFRVVDTFSLSALVNSYLWFSDLNSFNDPFEGILAFEEGFDDTLLENLVFKEKIKDEFDIVNKLISLSKVFSTSLSNPDSDPLLNNLMWSHYADGLRGFCLVFSKDELLSEIKSESKDSIRSSSILYVDSPNRLHLKDFMNKKGTGVKRNIDYLQKLVDSISNKSESWAYENEFRIISMGSNNIHRYQSNSLKEIIIGAKMPKELQTLTLNAARAANPNIIVKEARLRENSYIIDITMAPKNA